jgi:Ca2+-binding EF-hand superfamily protein
MRLAQSLFFLVAAALALAVGTAKAEDKIGKDAKDPGFNALDKNNDGYISRAEALGNPNLSKGFKQADKNNDGKLSRSEYLRAMTAQDASTAKKKIANAVDRKKDDHRSAATGASASKGDKIGKDAKDPGFNNLDKNNDGYLSRVEAAGNPTLAKNFKQVDKNGDGKLSRAEYLAAMTKQDATTAKNKVGNAIDRKHDDNKAGTGSSSTK